MNEQEAEKIIDQYQSEPMAYSGTDLEVEMFRAQGFLEAHTAAKAELAKALSEAKEREASLKAQINLLQTTLVGMSTGFQELQTENAKLQEQIASLEGESFERGEALAETMLGASLLSAAVERLREALGFYLDPDQTPGLFNRNFAKKALAATDALGKETT